jgi:hypothetical protein
MSDSEDDSDDAFAFAFMVVGSPFCIFVLALHCSSVYLHWALWKPFWRRYTDTVEGSVHQCVKRIRTRTHDTDEWMTKEIKHAIIEYTVNGIRLERTFKAVGRGEWGCDGKPSIGSLSLETFEAEHPLTLRLIPGIPESAMPEWEWEIQQRPIPICFYVITVIFTAMTSCWLGALVPLMDEGVWKRRALLVTLALYVTIFPLAHVVARRFALAEMKRQKTTTHFTAPYNELAFLFPVDAKEDETSRPQMQSLGVADVQNVV